MTRDEAAYTAIEMLVSLLITSLLLAALYTVLFQTQISFESQQEIMELRQAARVALDQMTADMRLAGLDLANVPDAVLEASADRMVFAADIDNGSSELPCDAAFELAPDGGVERFTYRREDGNLLRSVDCWNGSTWTSEYSDQVVARNVLDATPLFRYFDADNNELDPGGGSLDAGQRADVRTVRITMALEDTGSQALDRPRADFHMRTMVRLRNVQVP